MKRIPIERILCPVDFSEFSGRASDYASSLAQHYGARLVALHVVELWQYPSASFATTADFYEQFRQNLLAGGKEQLSAFMRTHTPSGMHPEGVTCEGTAIDCILSMAKQETMNLIVMGTHGRRGFDRLMLGSTTESVLRKAPCPVLAVHVPARNLATSQPARRLTLHEILFCTDFSEYANRALDYALSVAAEYDAHLTLVHVLEGLSDSSCLDETTKAFQRLDELVDTGGKDTSRISTMVRVGKAFKEISQLACERNADLIIMAVHGRNALDSAVFGSTTYRVVQLGNCPVLAVHI